MNRLYDSCLIMTLGCLAAFLLGLAFSLLFAWPVQMFWNRLFTRLFSLPEITFPITLHLIIYSALAQQNISATLFGNLGKYLYLCQMKSDLPKKIAI